MPAHHSVRIFLMQIVAALSIASAYAADPTKPGTKQSRKDGLL